MTVDLEKKNKQTTVRFISLMGYDVEINSQIWTLSRSKKINFNLLTGVGENLENSLRHLLGIYARTLSDAHTQNMYHGFLRLVRFLNVDGRIVDRISSHDLINYRSHLRPNREWHLSSLAGFLREWHAVGLPGIEDCALSLLNSVRLKGNEKGIAVAMRSPTKGAFSDLEFEALYSALYRALEYDDESLERFSLVALAIATGRRGIQLSALRHRDYIEVAADDGLTEYFLNIPRAKQRGGGFRGDFKLYALDPDLGKLISLLLEENASRFLRLTGEKKFDLAELPIFPNWRFISAAAQKAQGLALEITGDRLHRPANSLAFELRSTCSALNVISERTGEPLNILLSRFRITLATRAAREGCGPLVIAELLDHSDTQNARHYTENVPEHAEAIDRAVAWQLAPYAQAFSGTLVDREADAVRGDDPASRIRSNAGDYVGTCGKSGFCGARPPIACYTCRKFQPWLDAPHERYLDELLVEEEKIARITGDKTIAHLGTSATPAVSGRNQKTRPRPLWRMRPLR